jgi:hypothetical protein
MGPSEHVKCPKASYENKKKERKYIYEYVVIKIEISYVGQRSLS